jgi:hypothetical protein
MDYYKKIRQFNKRKDYSKDVFVAQLFLEYCIRDSKIKNVFFIGTGLGKDLKIINNSKGLKISGIEPRVNFHKEASKAYEKLNAKLLKMGLGKFVEKSKKLTGIFLFIHSLNHIPKTELEKFSNAIKNSFIIIINPNPELEGIVGKTDKTVITYLNSKKIEKILGCHLLFDFYYNPVCLKGKEVFLRQVLLFKK